MEFFGRRLAPLRSVVTFWECSQGLHVVLLRHSSLLKEKKENSCARVRDRLSEGSASIPLEKGKDRSQGYHRATPVRWTSGCPQIAVLS